MMYGGLADIYDSFMSDADYKGLVDYIEEILESEKAKVDVVVDLGCGTGSFAVEMAKRDYDVIGIDNSVEMLSNAKNKAVDEDLDILLLQQDMCEFELYDKADLIVSFMDTVNYITDEKVLKKLFSNVNEFLEDDGLFIFDMNTPYKFEEILADNTFHYVDDDVAYIWQSSYDKDKKYAEHDITMFAENEDGSYERYDELHSQRCYEADEVKVYLEENNLKVKNIYCNRTFDEFSKDVKVDRIFFVCGKKV